MFCVREQQPRTCVAPHGTVLTSVAAATIPRCPLKTPRSTLDDFQPVIVKSISPACRYPDDRRCLAAMNSWPTGPYLALEELPYMCLRRYVFSSQLAFRADGCPYLVVPRNMEAAPFAGESNGCIWADAPLSGGTNAYGK